ncbi:hypothetical protein [Gordonia neofelifaecis]|uniref:Uncharacterized protein n=1 Tax=Gordonia neofelifaecis NRRL B-59395 TaxID=644548 RepID=F1YJE8_9ACTN|nr:hypothetical protein [Gordonia neofelifaecis]EGD55181.1 hypothetical protein SCNU_09924 [Gordonia neofelifaecis NRRL B-59395]
MAENSKQDRTISYAARVVLALTDEDLDSAFRALTEASTSRGLGGLQAVAVALGQMAADRMTPADAEILAAACLDAEATR